MTDNFSDEYSFYADKIASAAQNPEEGTPDNDVTGATDNEASLPVVPMADTTEEAPIDSPPIKPLYSPIPEEPVRRARKKSGFGKGLRRCVAFLAAAALFGVVASGAFLGFNELYYLLNPQARPAYHQAPSGSNSAGGQGALNTSIIASTAVASSTSVATADVSDIVDRAMPSLVSIFCTFRTSTSFFGYLYEDTTEGSGSGIILGKNDTELLIATNNHVVDDALTTEITFIDGTKVAASVRGTDDAADLAIVSVALSDIPKDTLDAISIASLGSSDSIKVGQMVIAIGNALGYGQTTTVGYLSAKNREITVTDSSTGKSTKLNALQVDAAINPGNSGGALLNTRGEVIGINSAKLSSTSVEGIGYAIPIDSAIDILDELMNREILTEEEQGYLGVYLSQNEITDEIASLYGFPMGVYISDVIEGGPAQRGGIFAGDIITKINGSDVTTRSQLQEKVNSYRCGTVIHVTLQRLVDGVYTEHELDVELGSKTLFN